MGGIPHVCPVDSKRNENRALTAMLAFWVQTILAILMSVIPNSLHDCCHARNFPQNILPN
jgi:hypothetical protein